MNEEIPSRAVAGNALVLTLLLLASHSVAAAPVDLDRRLAECAGLSDPSDRLACFDSVAADRQSGRSTAAARPPVAGLPAVEPPEQPAPAAQPSPAQAEARPVPSPIADAEADPPGAVSGPDEASFGAEMLERPDQEARDRGARQISAELVRVEKQPYGEQVFHLSNDQVWVELAPGRGLYREGQTVTVRRALMGGYMLQADGVRAARVRRIR